MHSCLVGQSVHLGGHFISPPLPMPRSGPGSLCPSCHAYTVYTLHWWLYFPSLSLCLSLSLVALRIDSVLSFVGVDVVPPAVATAKSSLRMKPPLVSSPIANKVSMWVHTWPTLPHPPSPASSHQISSDSKPWLSYKTEWLPDFRCEYTISWDMGFCVLQLMHFASPSLALLGDNN